MRESDLAILSANLSRSKIEAEVGAGWFASAKHSVVSSYGSVKKKLSGRISLAINNVIENVEIGVSEVSDYVPRGYKKGNEEPDLGKDVREIKRILPMKPKDPFSHRTVGNSVFLSFDEYKAMVEKSKLYDRSGVKSRLKKKMKMRQISQTSRTLTLKEADVGTFFYSDCGVDAVNLIDGDGVLTKLFAKRYDLSGRVSSAGMVATQDSCDMLCVDLRGGKLTPAKYAHFAAIACDKGAGLLLMTRFSGCGSVELLGVKMRIGDLNGSLFGFSPLTKKVVGQLADINYDNFVTSNNIRLTSAPFLDAIRDFFVDIVQILSHPDSIYEKGDAKDLESIASGRKVVTIKYGDEAESGMGFIYKQTLVVPHHVSKGGDVVIGDKIFECVETYLEQDVCVYGGALPKNFYGNLSSNDPVIICKGDQIIEGKCVSVCPYQFAFPGSPRFGWSGTPIRSKVNPDLVVGCYSIQMEGSDYHVSVSRKEHWYNKVIGVLDIEDKLMLSIPCGTGKSTILMRELANHYNRILVIEPRKAIVEQVPSTLGEMWTGVSGKEELLMSYDKLFVTHGKIANQLAEDKQIFSSYDIIVIDECHDPSWQMESIMKYVNGHFNGKVLALTATPNSDEFLKVSLTFSRVGRTIITKGGLTLSNGDINWAIKAHDSHNVLIQVPYLSLVESSRNKWGIGKRHVIKIDKEAIKAKGFKHFEKEISANPRCLIFATGVVVYGITLKVDVVVITGHSSYTTAEWGKVSSSVNGGLTAQEIVQWSGRVGRTRHGIVIAPTKCDGERSDLDKKLRNKVMSSVFERKPKFEAQGIEFPIEAGKGALRLPFSMNTNLGLVDSMGYFLSSGQFADKLRNEFGVKIGKGEVKVKLYTIKGSVVYGPEYGMDEMMPLSLMRELQPDLVGNTDLASIFPDDSKWVSPEETNYGSVFLTSGMSSILLLGLILLAAFWTVNHSKVTRRAIVLNDPDFKTLTPIAIPSEVVPRAMHPPFVISKLNSRCEINEGEIIEDTTGIYIQEPGRDGAAIMKKVDSSMSGNILQSSGSITMTLLTFIIDVMLLSSLMLIWSVVIRTGSVSKLLVRSPSRARDIQLFCRNLSLAFFGKDVGIRTSSSDLKDELRAALSCLCEAGSHVLVGLRDWSDNVIIPAMQTAWYKIKSQVHKVASFVETTTRAEDVNTDMRGAHQPPQVTRESTNLTTGDQLSSGPIARNNVSHDNLPSSVNQTGGNSNQIGDQARSNDGESFSDLFLSDFLVMGDILSLFFTFSLGFFLAVMRFLCADILLTSLESTVETRTGVPREQPSDVGSGDDNKSDESKNTVMRKRGAARAATPVGDETLVPVSELIDECVNFFLSRVTLNMFGVLPGIASTLVSQIIHTTRNIKIVGDITLGSLWLSSVRSVSVMLVDIAGDAGVKELTIKEHDDALFLFQVLSPIVVGLLFKASAIDVFHASIFYLGTWIGQHFIDPDHRIGTIHRIAGVTTQVAVLNPRMFVTMLHKKMSLGLPTIDNFMGEKEERIKALRHMVSYLKIAFSMNWLQEHDNSKETNDSSDQESKVSIEDIESEGDDEEREISETSGGLSRLLFTLSVAVLVRMLSSFATSLHSLICQLKETVQQIGDGAEMVADHLSTTSDSISRSIKELGHVSVGAITRYDSVILPTLGIVHSTAISLLLVARRSLDAVRVLPSRRQVLKVRDAVLSVASLIPVWLVVAMPLVNRGVSGYVFDAILDVIQLLSSRSFREVVFMTIVVGIGHFFVHLCLMRSVMLYKKRRCSIVASSGHPLLWLVVSAILGVLCALYVNFYDDNLDLLAVDGMQVISMELFKQLELTVISVSILLSGTMTLISLGSSSSLVKFVRVVIFMLSYLTSRVSLRGLILVPHAMVNTDMRDRHIIKNIKRSMRDPSVKFLLVNALKETGVDQILELIDNHADTDEIPMLLSSKLIKGPDACSSQERLSVTEDNVVSGQLMLPRESRNLTTIESVSSEETSFKDEEVIDRTGDVTLLEGVGESKEGDVNLCSNQSLSVMVISTLYKHLNEADVLRMNRIVVQVIDSMSRHIYQESASEPSGISRTSVDVSMLTLILVMESSKRLVSKSMRRGTHLAKTDAMAAGRLLDVLNSRRVLGIDSSIKFPKRPSCVSVINLLLSIFLCPQGLILSLLMGLVFRCEISSQSIIACDGFTTASTMGKVLWSLLVLLSILQHHVTISLTFEMCSGYATVLTSGSLTNFYCLSLSDSPLFKLESFERGMNANKVLMNEKSPDSTIRIDEPAFKNFIPIPSGLINTRGLLIASALLMGLIDFSPSENLLVIGGGKGGMIQGMINSIKRNSSILVLSLEDPVYRLEPSLIQACETKGIRVEERLIDECHLTSRGYSMLIDDTFLNQYTTQFSNVRWSLDYENQWFLRQSRNVRRLGKGGILAVCVPAIDTYLVARIVDLLNFSFSTVDVVFDPYPRGTTTLMVVARGKRSLTDDVVERVFIERPRFERIFSVEKEFADNVLMTIRNIRGYETRTDRNVMSELSKKCFKGAPKIIESPSFMNMMADNDFFCGDLAAYTYDKVMSHLKTHYSGKLVQTDIVSDNNAYKIIGQTTEPPVSDREHVTGVSLSVHAAYEEAGLLPLSKHYMIPSQSNQSVLQGFKRRFDFTKTDVCYGDFEESISFLRDMLISNARGYDFSPRTWDELLETANLQSTMGYLSESTSKNIGEELKGDRKLLESVMAAATRCPWELNHLFHASPKVEKKEIDTIGLAIPRVFIYKAGEVRLVEMALFQRLNDFLSDHTKLPFSAAGDIFERSERMKRIASRFKRPRFIEIESSKWDGHKEFGWFNIARDIFIEILIAGVGGEVAAEYCSATKAVDGLGFILACSGHLIQFLRGKQNSGSWDTSINNKVVNLIIAFQLCINALSVKSWEVMERVGILIEGDDGWICAEEDDAEVIQSLRNVVYASAGFPQTGMPTVSDNLTDSRFCSHGVAIVPDVNIAVPVRDAHEIFGRLLVSLVNSGLSQTYENYARGLSSVISYGAMYWFIPEIRHLLYLVKQVTPKDVFPRSAHPSEKWKMVNLLGDLDIKTFDLEEWVITKFNVRNVTRVDLSEDDRRKLRLNDFTSLLSVTVDSVLRRLSELNDTFSCLSQIAMFTGMSSSADMIVKEIKFLANNYSNSVIFVPTKSMLFEILLKGGLPNNVYIRASNLVEALRRAPVNTMLIPVYLLNEYEKTLLNSMRDPRTLRKVSSRRMEIVIFNGTTTALLSPNIVVTSSQSLFYAVILLALSIAVITSLSWTNDSNDEKTKLTSIMRPDTGAIGRSVNPYLKIYNKYGRVLIHPSEVNRVLAYEMADAELHKTYNLKRALRQTEPRRHSFMDDPTSLKVDMMAVIKYERRFAIVNVDCDGNVEIIVFYRNRFSNDFKETGDLKWIKKSVDNFLMKQESGIFQRFMKRMKLLKSHEWTVNGNMISFTKWYGTTSYGQIDRLGDFMKSLSLKQGSLLMRISDHPMLRKDGKRANEFFYKNNKEVVHNTEGWLVIGESSDADFRDCPRVMGADVSQVNISVVNFDNKQDQLYFRGGPTGAGWSPVCNIRLKLIRELSRMRSPLFKINVGFNRQHTRPRIDKGTEDIGITEFDDDLLKEYESIASWSQYKYLLVIEGNEAPDRIASCLACGSVMVYVRPTLVVGKHTWASDELEHGVNCIIADATADSVFEAVEDIARTPKRAATISSTARKLGMQLLNKFEQMSYMSNLIWTSKTFGMMNANQQHVNESVSVNKPGTEFDISLRNRKDVLLNIKFNTRNEATHGILMLGYCRFGERSTFEKAMAIMSELKSGTCSPEIDDRVSLAIQEAEFRITREALSNRFKLCCVRTLKGLTTNDLGILITFFIEKGSPHNSATSESKGLGMALNSFMKGLATLSWFVHTNSLGPESLARQGMVALTEQELKTFKCKEPFGEARPGDNYIFVVTCANVLVKPSSNWSAFIESTASFDKLRSLFGHADIFDAALLN